MAQYEAKLRSLAQGVALPSSLTDPALIVSDVPAETDDQDESADVAIIAARLGGVALFD
jgi:hypothetical protein